MTENRGEGRIDVEPAAGIEPATSGLQARCSTAELHRRKLERVGGIEPTSPAWKAGALPLSYTRGKGCWPCHSTGRRADRDYQGFGAPPPILVLRFTLLGAGNPQHCPNQQGGRLKQHDFNVVCWHCHSRPSCWLRPSTGTGFCPSQGGVTDSPDFFQSSTRCNPLGRLLVAGFEPTTRRVPPASLTY